jgi:predicted NBD/HSP70 family sugar kinase/biotin operon repressor
MSGAPGSLEALRLENRTRVVSALQQRGYASRADLVRATGLSRTTVSSLVADLLAEGLVVERSSAVRRPPSPNGGRPGTLLTLDPSSGGFVGIDFAHDSVGVAIVDRSGALLADARRPIDVDHHAGPAVDTAADLVEALLVESTIPRARVLGVGAAVSAPLRSRHRAVASERIFPSWADMDLSAVLSRRLGLAVQIGNDANLGALAEATFGAGRGIKNLVYVMLSAGVGAGIVIGGSLYEGESGTAGELGHVVVDPGGQVCRCGNRGCLETVAGVGALTRALAHAHGPQARLDDLLRLNRDGDPGARRLTADAGRAVGQALAGLCSVLDPGLLIIGGELAGAGEVLLDAIRETVDRQTSPATGHSYAVVAGALGARAEVLGAAVMAMGSASRQHLTEFDSGASQLSAGLE